MKKLISCFLGLQALMSVSQAVYAQDLWAYSINGSVEIRPDSSSGWRQLSPSQALHLSDSLRFGPYSSLTVLDRSHDKVYAIHGADASSVADLVKGSSTRSKKTRANLVSYLWNSFRENNSVDNHRRAAGVVYRDNSIDNALAYSVATGKSDLPVEFVLIGESDGLPISGSVSIGQTAVVNVINHSQYDLFVNLLDKDATGYYSPCFPISNTQQMMQLFIPALSSVILSSFPVIVGEPRGKDNLILIASTEAFDVDNVAGCLNNNNYSTSEEPLGTYTVELFVQ
ncbi:MAG: hypothetical protein J6X71_00585 [Bacteroidales bacterium]|nr:hypothetical protein [Bacteroidales bacterium]